jgi:ABC-type bacteriocin/lantibiotic exporter with double-glycine peptidase domain
MRASRGAAVLCASLLAACVPYSGGARAIAPTSVTQGAGWSLAVAPTIMQRADNDCGPAALAMVSGFWHRPLGLAAVVAALPPLTDQGVALGALRDLARRHQLLAFAVKATRDDLETELAAGNPTIVGLLRPHGAGRQRHFEVVIAWHRMSARIVTIDPSAGWVVRTWHDFDEEWSLADRPALVILGVAADEASR